jgi:hypothetical protein
LISGLVSLHHLPGGPGPDKQIEAYRLVLGAAKARWLAIIDLDEFLMPTGDDDLRAVLTDYERYGGVAVWWRNYGSAGHYFPPPLQTEALVWRSADTDLANAFVKCVVAPDRVVGPASPHSFHYRPPFGPVDECGVPLADPQAQVVDRRPGLGDGRLRLNHYRVRSYLDFQNKVRRWAGRGHPELRRPGHPERYWLMGDLNEVHDPAALRFVPRMKALLVE